MDKLDRDQERELLGLKRWIRARQQKALAQRPLWDKNLPERARVKALFHRAALTVYGGAGLRKRGADIWDIQEVLRHADIGTTQIYTQMAREELRKKLPRRFIDYRPKKLV